MIPRHPRVKLRYLSNSSIVGIPVESCYGIEHGLLKYFRGKRLGMRVGQLTIRVSRDWLIAGFSCLPWTEILQTPIPNLRSSEYSFRGTSTIKPVFPCTVLNISSDKLNWSLRLMRWKSAIPPLCMNCTVLIRSDCDVPESDTHHDIAEYKWMTVVQRQRPFRGRPYVGTGRRLSGTDDHGSAPRTR